MAARGISPNRIALRRHAVAVRIGEDVRDGFRDLALGRGIAALATRIVAQDKGGDAAGIEEARGGQPLKADADEGISTARQNERKGARLLPFLPRGGEKEQLMPAEQPVSDVYGVLVQRVSYADLLII